MPSGSFTVIHSASLVALGFASAAYLATKWIRPKPLPGIPHFPVTSFWGDIPRFARDAIRFGTIFEPGASFEQAMNELGPVFQILIGPFYVRVVVADIFETEDVMLRSPRSKAIEISDSMIAAFSGSMPFSMPSLKSNDIWRAHRRLSAPLMGSKYLRAMTPTISSNIQNLVELWKWKIIAAKDAGALCFSCQNDFEFSSLDSISHILTGRPADTVLHASRQLAGCRPTLDIYRGATFPVSDPPLFKAIRWLEGCISDSIMMPTKVGSLYQTFLRCTPRYKRHYGVIVNYVNDAVARTRTLFLQARELGEDPPECKTMIDMFVEREQNQGQETLSSRELTDEVLAFLIAGHDTTSMVLQWGVKLLTEAPAVQHKLRAELLSELEDSPEQRPLTFAEMTMTDKTPYLEAVVAEILRCGAIAIASPRMNTEAMVILGRPIPANTDITFMTAFSSLRASEEHFENARTYDHLRSESSLKYGTGGRRPWNDCLAFNPDRWLVNHPDNPSRKMFDPKAGVSVQFGLGPRSCAGKTLALLQLKLYIATLNLAFFFDEVPAEHSDNKAVLALARAPQSAYVNLKVWKSE